VSDERFAAATALFALDPESVRCPYPVFATLRDEAPVAWFDELDAFVVTRYDLIVEVLKQPETFSSRHTTGPVSDREVSKLIRELAADDEMGAIIEQRARVGTGRVLVRADPPVHTRQRALVNRAFSPAAIRRLEPEIDALANSLIDRFIDRGRVEFVAEFARPLPMTVIARALGVALDQMDDFKRWSDEIVLGFGKMHFEAAELRQITKARSDLEAYLLEVIAEREKEPANDLVSQIVHARIDGERLTRHEMLDMIAQFLLAGNETTAKLITATALRLACDPELAARLRVDPLLVEPLAEEVLRLEPPSTGLFRTATIDYELGGVEIPADASLWLAYAAGNRDPAQFDTPDECLLTRSGAAPHLGFGLGPHFCLGAGLARAESRIAIHSLLTRCDELRLDIAIGDIPYEQSYLVHGIQRLPLTFRPACA
jgi:cytochrome P450